MNKNSADEIYEVDKLNLLDCSKLEFSREKSGFMTLNFQGQTYNKVNLTRLLPFFTKTTYISVSYENSEKEFREIGVIKDMTLLPEKQYNIVEEFLEYKYYMPEITKVISIKENMAGAIFVKVECNAGTKTICIKDWYSNFRMLTEKYLYVLDADGNKYYCPDVSKLDKKSIATLEMFT